MLRIEPDKLMIKKAELMLQEKELGEAEEELLTVLRREDEAILEEQKFRLEICKKKINEYRRTMHEFMISLDVIVNLSKQCAAEQAELLDHLVKIPRRGAWIPISFSKEDQQIVDVIRYKEERK